jgi:glucosamine-6-phosphate deaminase
MSKAAARLVAAQILLRPSSVIGLPTGSTPIGMYGELAEMYRRKEVDFSEAKTFNLDEYYPISHENPQSYRRFMHENLYSKVNLKAENIHIPNGEAENPEEECARYDALVRKNGIDMQVLGVGPNGHLGFNEPDAEMRKQTHVTPLTESTISANSRFFASPGDVPKTALTLGLGGIMKAKKILLLVGGREKREPLKKLLSGVITTATPVTILNLHPDVVVLADRVAAGE